MRSSNLRSALAVASMMLCCEVATAQRQMETLDRGVIAMRTSSSNTYISWRMLGSDDEGVAFNLYRSVNGGAGIKLNGSTPITTTTNYQDSPGSVTLGGSTVGYYVRPVVNGIEQAPSATWTIPAGSGTDQYFDVPFTTDPGPNGPYDTKFTWVGDFNGDGKYDFLCDRLSTLGAYEQFLEAYLQDGTFLWRMHMGPTSADQSDIYRPGAASISTGDGDNVTCFDLNGDNQAEAIVRTANGVTVTNAAGTTVTTIASGSTTQQFLTVIDGMTGVEIDSAPVPNNWVQHGTLQSKCFIAYLDGKHPSVVLYGYNRATSGQFYRQWTAWDFVGGQLVQRWTWAQNPSTQPGSEGHQVRIADVDNDGRDEIVDIGHVMDDDGTQLYVTELTHGDRFHVSDINPLRPGLETYAIQQNNPSFLATAYMKSEDGVMYNKWYANGVVDVGRGLALDMDPNHLGMEMFSTQPGIFNAEGDEIFANSFFPYEGLWWDGDRLREFVAGANGPGTSPIINKYDPNTGGTYRIYLNGGKNVYDYAAHNAYGGRPAFWGDILGDWREEMVLTKNDYTGLRVVTTITPAQDRRRTLMHNAQYRTQATTKGYVQASYVDYYLGAETSEDPPPPINDTDHTWVSGPAFNSTTCPNGESILFDLSGNNSAPVALTGSLAPSRVKVFSPIDYTFDGAGGSFTGTMKLLKSGAGSLTITGTHGYTGPTEVWDGALVVDGTLSASPVTVHGGIWGAPLAKGETGGRLSGSGTVGQPVTLAWRGAIAPGTGNGNAATLHLGGGLTCAKDTVLSLDVSNSSTSDLIAITGDLTLQGTTTLVIHPLEASLAPGTHTLVTYTGSFSGSLGDFAVDLPPGTPYSLANPAGAITLTIPVTRAPASITWKGGSNGNVWDLATTQNFTLGGSPDYFVSGDMVTFDSSGAPNTTANLVGDLTVGGVIVDSSLDYALSGTGSLSGSGGLTKSGAGTLTMGDDHGFTGPVAINGGTVSINSMADGGNPSSLGASGSASTNVVLNGGAIRHDGPQTSTNRGIRLNAGGGTLETPSASLQIGGTIDGSGSLTKTGPGLLIIGGNNSYSGGTIIDQGTLQLASDTANEFGLGTGNITFHGGTLSMTNNTGSYNNATYNIIVPDGETGRLNSDGRCELYGTLTGAGDFTFYTPFIRTNLWANWSAFSGVLHVIADGDGGDFRISNNNGYGNAALDFGDGVYAYYIGTSSNPTFAIGTLSGTSGAVLQGGASGTLTWQVGARNEDSTFAGPVVNSGGGTALTKVGSGALTLGGACTYTGATTVSAGRLRVDGSTSGSNITVQNGGTLGGSGSVTGNVTIQNGGGLEWNATPLAITGNLTFSGDAVVRAAAGSSPAPGNFTVLSYTGSLTGTPTLAWEPPAGSALTASFDTSTSGVITMTLTEPARDPGPITWTGASGFNWDTATSNWLSNASPTSFMTGDTASFTDAGNASSAINIGILVEPAAVIVDASQNYTFSGSGGISGDASLTKSGSGTLTVSSSHSYTGGTTIEGGTLVISNAAALGSGAVTLGGGTWATGTLAPQNSILVTANSGISGGHGGGQHGIKDISGIGTLTLTATSVFDLEGDLSGFAGTLALSGTGSFRFFNTSNNGSAAATFDLGTRSLQARSGAAFNLGALAGQAESYLQGAGGGGNNTQVTYTIGGNDADSEFAGVITNGNAAASIVKTGIGTLTLSGASDYTGTTTVSSGKLSVTGSLGATATSIGTSAALGGSGSIGGAVTCNGTLAPGSSAGTLTLSSGLALSSTSILDYELGSTSDLTAVTGNLTLDGIVNVTAVSGFGPGTYTLITYTPGSLTNNTLDVGSVPLGYTASVNTATAGQVKLVVDLLNSPPQITSGPTATPSTVTTTTTGVAVTATDDTGEGILTYTWSYSGPAAVVFSPNGNNTAKNTTATFSAPGAYTLTVTVSDVPGLTAVDSTNVTVTATPTTLSVSPEIASIEVGGSQPFSATVLDQFGDPVGSPAIDWSTTGGGTIDVAGLYTATAAGGPWDVTATSGGLSDSAQMTVAPATAIVTPENLSATYDGSPKAVSATTDPDGLNVVVTYTYPGSGESTTPPTDPGTYPVVAVVDDPNYVGQSSASLVIEPRSFENWEDEMFTPEQILAGESAMDQDPDHDGLTNLAEYSLGSLPYVFTPQPPVTADETSMSITFQRPAFIGDVTYHAEAGADFETWSELTLEVLNPGGDPENVRATYSFPVSRPAKQFLRLRFEK